MSIYKNSVNLAGVLERDPFVADTGKVAKMSVRVGKNDNDVVTVTSFDKALIEAAQGLRKGDVVIITGGYVRSNTWTNKNGIKVTDQQIIAGIEQFTASPAEPRVGDQGQDPDESDDGLPF